MEFFKFCTGCTTVPIDGFHSLAGTRNKYYNFTIESSTDSKNRLIEAMTCFNRIALPKYNNKSDMQRVINTIIDNDTNYFGKQ